MSDTIKKKPTPDLRRAVLKNNIRCSAANSGSGSIFEALVVDTDPDFTREFRDNVTSYPRQWLEDDDDDSEYGENDDEEDVNSPGRRLEWRFWQVVLKDANASLTNAELSTTYADASEEVLPEIIVACAAFICMAAEALKQLDGEVAEVARTLINKWFRVSTDMAHCDQIFEERSIDELRHMLVAVFGDLETYVEDTIVEGEHVAVVVPGIAPLDHNLIGNLKRSGEDKESKRGLDLSKTVLMSNTARRGSNTGHESGTQARNLVLTDSESASLEADRPNITVNARDLVPTLPAVDDEETGQSTASGTAVLAMSARSQLRQQVSQCIQSEAQHDHVPTLYDLQTTYADATKEDLLAILTLCGAALCLGANLAIAKEQNVEVAEALANKWERCNSRATPLWRPHMMWISERKSLEEVRELLAAAFFDMKACVAKQDGMLIVKADAGMPQAGKYWW